MSYVTSALVMVSVASKQVEEEITSHEFERAQFFKKLDDEGAGGGKYMECDVYAAGFNYVGGEEIEEWFKSLPWGNSGAAFLIWETNGEFRGSASVGWKDDYGWPQP